MTKDFEISPEHRKIFGELHKGSKRIKIYAGPGTGKTSTLIELVIHLLNEGNANAKEILFLTFSRESMQDIRTKFYQKLTEKKINQDQFKDLLVFTFHGFCNYLRKTMKFESNFTNATLMDEEEQFLEAYSLRQGIMGEDDEKTDEEIDENIMRSWDGEPEADYWHKISTSDEESSEEEYETETDVTISVAEMVNKISIVQENYRSVFAKQDYSEELEEILGHYLGQYAHKRLNLDSLDYGMLLRLVTETLRKEPRLKKILNQRYKYIFVDEFQDTNSLQDEFLELLSGKSTVIIVGDKKQSIYGFRGSDNTLLETKYPRIKPCYLTSNRRSTGNIITFSNEFFGLNEEEKVKPLDDAEKGLPVIINECDSHEDEAGRIVELISVLLDNGFKHSDIAVLTSSNKSSNKTGQLISILKTKFGDKLDVISKGGLFQNELLLELINLLESINNNEEYHGKLDLLVDTNNFRTYLVQSKSLLKTYYYILANSDAYKNNTDQKTISNFATFSNIINRFEDKHSSKLYYFLRYIHERKDMLDEEVINENEDVIRVLTYWGAKGLEFPVVIIPKVTDKTFPVEGYYPKQTEETQRTLELLPHFDPKKEKERAFYVAITRPQQLLYISYVNDRHNKKAYLIEKFRHHNQTTLLQDPLPSCYLSTHNSIPEMNIRPQHKERKKEKEMLELSWAKISTYWDCPYKYYLKYAAKFAFPKNRFFTYGDTVHRIINDINIEKPDDINIFLRSYNLDSNEDRAVIIDVKNYYRNYKEIISTQVECELPFREYIHDAIITGSVDLATINKNKMRIIEIKTGGKQPKEYPEKLNKSISQVVFYSIMFEAHRRTDEGEIFFTREKSPYKFLIDRTLKEKINSQIKMTIKLLKNNDYQINKHHCTICEYGNAGICNKRILDNSQFTQVTDESNDLAKELSELNYNE
jgi:DNA helicase II / ATP-dependent DNA helicase PcrA